MADAVGSAGSASPRGPAPAAHRPVALRIAVAGSAAAGATALLLVTSPTNPQILLTAGVAVCVAVVIYLVQPRAGVVAFITLGILICVGCSVALLRVGTVPWLLTGFWGGAATLLAGLLDLIGRDGNDAMVGVTVAAVVSLLVLSALGLGEYVRINWTRTARTMLEDLPTDAASPASSRLGSSGARFEQVSGGRWACYWVIRTRDVARTWESMGLALESSGWEIESNVPQREIVAAKDGYEIDIEMAPATSADEAASSVASATTPGESGFSVLALEALLGAEKP